jgi:hypothetical protein
VLGQARPAHLLCVIVLFAGEYIKTWRRRCACQQGVGRAAAQKQGAAQSHDDPCSYTCLTACRWFVLKQGKIYWFKSDVVTPVSGTAVGSVLHCSNL